MEQSVMSGPGAGVGHRASSLSQEKKKTTEKNPNSFFLNFWLDGGVRGNNNNKNIKIKSKKRRVGEKKKKNSQSITHNGVRYWYFLFIK